MIRMLALLMGLAFALPAQAAELIMFEEQGCSYCVLWKQDVGVIYHKTPEGKRAPLRMVDLHDTRPDDLTFIRGVRYTPTFVMIEGNQEIGRITGYPGDNLFWMMMAGLMKKLDKHQAGQAVIQQTMLIAR